MSAVESSGYLLGSRDAQETERSASANKRIIHKTTAEQQSRLNTQMSIWTEALGYALHPDIVASLPPNPRIADIACGTCAWFNALVPTLPSSSTPALHGFDISPSAFPPLSSLPPNTTLAIHDALTPFPSALHGTFDAVHLRLLLAALPTEAHWATVLANAAALLKPGAALQWDEHDVRHRTVVRGLRTEPAAMELSATRTLAALGPERVTLGFEALPQRMQRAGLASVMRDVVPTDRAGRRDALSAVELAAERRVCLAGAGAAWSIAQVEDCYSAARSEIAAGAYKRYDIGVCIGWNKVVRAAL